MAFPPKKPAVSIRISSGKGLPPVPDPDAPEPDADDAQAEAAPDNDADDSGNWPQWLDYHGEDERCDGCEYMAGDGSCPIVKIQVDPGGHCEAFSAKSDTASDAGAAPEGQPAQ